LNGCVGGRGIREVEARYVEEIELSRARCSPRPLADSSIFMEDSQSHLVLSWSAKPTSGSSDGRHRSWVPASIPKHNACIFCLAGALAVTAGLSCAPGRIVSSNHFSHKHTIRPLLHQQETKHVTQRRFYLASPSATYRFSPLNEGQRWERI